MRVQAAARKFDVVVFGAGGFTGRLVCEHIARDYQVIAHSSAAPLNRARRAPRRRAIVRRRPLVALPSLQGKVRWAMAGRDAAKLEEIKNNLAAVNPAMKVRGAHGRRR
jgi:short subunit dehydrogenase-like uncharacterized protein